MPDEEPMTHVYEHPDELGLGQHFAGKNERIDLDMDPGTEVRRIGEDSERELVLVAWQDRYGSDRITSIEPGFFADHFRRL